MKIYDTSREDYLKAILVLSKRMPEVRSADLASYLGFSRASISRAVSLLSAEDFVYVQDHGLYLTEKGKHVAQITYDKFLFFSEILIQIGVEPKVAFEDACRLEHAISDDSFNKLKAVFPEAKCSHHKNSHADEIEKIVLHCLQGKDD